MGNNMFSGSFPAAFAPGLKVLHAENNRLGGELPSDMSKLANLRSCLDVVVFTSIHMC